MTEEEIQQDLKDKAQILRWLVENNVDDVHNIGMTISKYYLGTLQLGGGS